MLPTVRFSESERERAVPDGDNVRRAVEGFRDWGCLLVENVFEVDFVDTLREAFLDRYRNYLEDRQYQDALRVGDKRFMVTIDVAPPFDAPHLYANPLMMPVMASLLGTSLILASFGSVVALPGAQEQHVHRDYPHLFEDAPVDYFLPSFAVTMIVPLVDLDETTSGTTRMWLGSHVLLGTREKQAGFVDPVAAKGSCLLMDYRLCHCGTENRSQRPRPILYNVYSRPWFRDTVNYKKQSPLRISDENLKRVPEEFRSLFAEAAIVDSTSDRP